MIKKHDEVKKVHKLLMEQSKLNKWTSVTKFFQMLTSSKGQNEVAKTVSAITEGMTHEEKSSQEIRALGALWEARQKTCRGITVEVKLVNGVLNWRTLATKQRAIQKEGEIWLTPWASQSKAPKVNPTAQPKPTSVSTPEPAPAPQPQPQQVQAIATLQMDMSCVVNELKEMKGILAATREQNKLLVTLMQMMVRGQQPNAEIPDLTDLYSGKADLGPKKLKVLMAGFDDTRYQALQKYNPELEIEGYCVTDRNKANPNYLKSLKNPHKHWDLIVINTGCVSHSITDPITKSETLKKAYMPLTIVNAKEVSRVMRHRLGLEPRAWGEETK